ncbi:Positive regulator of sigma E activity [Candidatus Terasakiella magnetica]|nr:Positive regulator of sigma E activity [Candidatus Terasakiella magnetica]
MESPVSSSFPGADESDLVEGFARVVAVEGGRVWLEPEQTKSCGTCASAGLCSIGKDLGEAKRLEARRFQLPGNLGLRVGERVVVGVREDTLVKGAMTAFGLPLLTLLIGGITGQEWGQSDGMAALGAASGLVLGLAIARVLANIFTARGILTPRFLRRAHELPQEAECHPEHG